MKTKTLDELLGTKEDLLCQHKLTTVDDGNNESDLKMKCLYQCSGFDFKCECYYNHKKGEYRK